MADWIKGVPSPEQVRAHAEGSQEDPKIGMWLCKHDGGSYVENLYVYDLEYEAVCPHKVRGTYCFKPRENARYLPLTAEGLPTDYEALKEVAAAAKETAKDRAEMIARLPRSQEDLACEPRPSSANAAAQAERFRQRMSAVLDQVELQAQEWKKERAELEAALAEARKDTDRLNWLDDQTMTTIETLAASGECLRAAIDVVREKGGEAKDAPDAER